MKESPTSDIAVPLLALVFIVLLTHPFGAWMPDMATMAIATILLFLLALYGGFLWREKARDEREAAHRMMADRIAFLAGVAALAIGIIIQAFQHSIDAWLLTTLAVMIIAKAATRIYSRAHH